MVGKKERRRKKQAINWRVVLLKLYSAFRYLFWKKGNKVTMVFKVNADPGEGNRDIDTTEPQGPETQLTNQSQDRRASALSCDKEDNVISKVIGFGYMVSTMR